MRLGLLGPANGDVGGLGRAAEFLLNGARVHRAIYLGNDGALDRAVAAWARKLVGDDPSDDGAWARAAAIAQAGTPAAIDRFVATERARQRLKALEALPEPSARSGAAVSRAMERLGSHVAVLIHDREALEEEDLAKAELLFFGRSDAPSITQLGPRWFVTPGPIGSAGGGLAVLDDERDDVVVTLFDATSWSPIRREALVLQRAAAGAER